VRSLRTSFLDRLIASRHRGRALAFAAAGFVLLLFTVVIPATGPFEVPEYTPSRGETLRGVISEIVAERTTNSIGTAIAERLIVDVDGQQIVSERSYLEGQIGIVSYQVGDRVLVTARETPDGEIYAISDRDRAGPLLLLGLLFVALVLAIGRWHGFGSLLGLGASALVIFRFVIPGILAGHDPVVIAILGALVLVTTTLLLAHGPNVKTVLAIVSTALSLLLTGILAGTVVRLLQLGGLADEESAQLVILTDAVVEPRGLLLAGFVIGALGVLDDVTATQVSTVSELRDANPALSRRELYARAMNVGRDHVASTVNTLVLAYAGAALPLLLLIATQGEALGVLLQRELVATELARTLAGSIGIVAAVPISTALGALFLGRRRGEHSEGPSVTLEG
jgi:uncharacterized membrane protein